MKNNPLIFENEKCKNKGKRCYKRIKKPTIRRAFSGYSNLKILRCILEFFRLNIPIDLFMGELYISNVLANPVSYFRG